jgi:glutamate synthase (NADPH/NADH) small chain
VAEEHPLTGVPSLRGDSILAEPQTQPKIDRKERLQVPPQPMPKQDPATRVGNWDETYLGFDLEAAKLEAHRCIQCPAAPCTKACPVHNDIPGAFLKLEAGDVLGAAATFRQTSNLPEICGRICPQEVLCEGHCVVGKNNIPVQIGKLEFFATDYERRQRGFPHRAVAPATGRRVAIVGAGPAGLAVAEELAVRGHACVVYDSWAEPGGILLYGIPSFKLSKQIVREKVEQLRCLGVEFVQNCTVGRDPTLAALVREYDAVFLGIGAGVGGRLRIEGEDLPQVYLATDFLVRGNVAPEFRPRELQDPIDAGERVVVIGGGDTSMDCVRTARRLGASQVACVYRRTEAEMRGREEERRHAREEGVQFLYLTIPLRFLADAHGRLRAVECQRMELGEPDESGRRRPIPVPGSEFELPCDTAVVAIGYSADPVLREPDLGLELDRAGLVLIDRATGRTNVRGVFAGGDDVNGADLVVTALADGRRAAAAMDAYLRSLDTQVPISRC